VCDPDEPEAEDPDATPLWEGEGAQLVDLHGMPEAGTTRDHPSSPADRTGL
jgi:hypothetical protein